MSPILKKLRLPEHARAVVIHADDIGMSYSTVAGFADLLDAGLLSSASVMTPCPWFPAAAAMLRDLSDHPRLDIGVHLTLTSEWDAYRWGPLSTRSRATGLLDDEGYFHPREVDVWRHADPSAIGIELRSQIETALAAGLRITHIDSHMGTLFHPQLLSIYVELAHEYGVPAFLMRPGAEHIQSKNLPAEDNQALAHMAAEIEAAGLPLFDRFHVMNLNRRDLGLDEARDLLASLPPGTMTYLILHPALDAADLRAFAADWRARVSDYELLTHPAFRDLLHENNMVILNMADLRDVWRSA